MASVGELTLRDDAWAERLGRRLPELCALYPVLWLGLAYHLAWTAEQHLGHWPRPSVDDPKGLGGLVPALHLALILLLVMWPLSWAVGLFGVGHAVRLGVGWRGALLRLAVLVGVNALALAVARWDPGQVMAWVMD